MRPVVGSGCAAEVERARLAIIDGECGLFESGVGGEPNAVRIIVVKQRALAFLDPGRHAQVLGLDRAPGIDIRELGFDDVIAVEIGGPVDDTAQAHHRTRLPAARGNIIRPVAGLERGRAGDLVQF